MNKLDAFRIFYNHSIYPELKRMEVKRNRVLYLIGFSILLGIILITIAQLLHIFALSLIIVLLVCFYTAFLFYRIRQYVKTFKPRIMELILDFIDNSINYSTLSYEPDRGVGFANFKKSNIFQLSNPDFQEEDYIKGNIGSVAFELAETRVKNPSKVSGRMEWIFDGVFMKAKLQIPIKGSILIIPKTEKPYLSRTIKQWVGAGHVKVNNLIRNPQFRAQFETYANKKSNPVGFLTEGLQASILQYTQAFDKLFYLAYKNGIIYMAISEEKDILEPHLFKSNLKFSLIKEFYDDITILLHIQEDLDLHH